MKTITSILENIADTLKSKFQVSHNNAEQTAPESQPMTRDETLNALFGPLASKRPDLVRALYDMNKPDIPEPIDNNSDRWANLINERNAVLKRKLH